MLDVEHHASEDGQEIISGKRALGEERWCGKVGACRHYEQHRHKRRGLRLWAGIGGWEKRSTSVAGKEG